MENLLMSKQEMERFDKGEVARGVALDLQTLKAKGYGVIKGKDGKPHFVPDMACNILICDPETVYVSNPYDVVAIKGATREKPFVLYTKLCHVEMGSDCDKAITAKLATMKDEKQYNRQRADYAIRAKYGLASAVEVFYNTDTGRVETLIGEGDEVSLTLR